MYSPIFEINRKLYNLKCLCSSLQYAAIYEAEQAHNPKTPELDHNVLYAVILDQVEALIDVAQRLEVLARMGEKP